MVTVLTSYRQASVCFIYNELFACVKEHIGHPKMNIDQNMFDLH